MWALLCIEIWQVYEFQSTFGYTAPVSASSYVQRLYEHVKAWSIPGRKNNRTVDGWNPAPPAMYCIVAPLMLPPATPIISMLGWHRGWCRISAIHDCVCFLHLNTSNVKIQGVEGNPIYSKVVQDFSHQPNELNLFCCFLLADKWQVLFMRYETKPTPSSHTKGPHDKPLSSTT